MFGFWLFDLFERDGVAECFELALEPLGAVFDGVAPALPVWAEVSVWDLVADDVVVGDEQVVTDRADCFRFAASAAQLCEVRGEVGAFGPDRGAGAFGELLGEPARTVTGSTRTPMASRLVVTGASPGP